MYFYRLWFGIFFCIYIPHWLDSMPFGLKKTYTVANLHSTLVRFYGNLDHGLICAYIIYIPHWLDSMVPDRLHFYPTNAIYIPHWLDSMPDDVFNIAQNVIIYIPHWLDSMGRKRTRYARLNAIYIPHWLDSMTSRYITKYITKDNLHSTLVRFYGEFRTLYKSRKKDLHSTLVRFYETGRATIWPAEYIYIPHWLDSMCRNRH